MTEAESTRCQAIMRQLYDKAEQRGHAYPDLRRLTKPRAMQKRLHMIDVRLQQLDYHRRQVEALPQELASDANFMATHPEYYSPVRDDITKQRRRLENERLLLTTKYELYTNSPNMPMASQGPGRKFLRLTDKQPEDFKESKSESRRLRREHTIVLMHYAYIDLSYDELVALRDH
jgi:hypothetical protein